MTDPEKARLPSKFVCHSSLVPGLKVVFSGLYDVNLVPPPATILDIGANSGAFTLWALGKWPDAKITAYEPAALARKHFMLNVRPDLRHPQVEIVGKAVTSRDEEWVYLFSGAHNTGESSLFFSADNVPQGESVQTIHPKELPPAEFVKLDVEASELDIVKHYPHLDRCRAVALEWHVVTEVPELVLTMAKAGLRLTRQDAPEHLLIFQPDSERR
jgi:FkbM family methyltransferase